MLKLQKLNAQIYYQKNFRSSYYNKRKGMKIVKKALYILRSRFLSTPEPRLRIAAGKVLDFAVDFRNSVSLLLSVIK